MKNTTILRGVALGLCALLLTFSNLHAQTPGLIVRPTSNFSAVLDPNQDGYTSPTTSGFVTTDVGTGYTEIPYKIIPPFKLEPTADLMRGPSDKFTDLVRLNADESGMYVFNDGSNLLFRLRLGDIISGSKGYSILIDADQKFGATGPYADPNYQAATTGNNGNPGFEFEVVFESNFRVAIYNVDGTSTPVLLTPTYDINTNSQISIAISTVSNTPDYFYDFYVPLAALNTGATPITATTPIRISGTTVMAPQAAIGGPKSDIYGYDGTDYMKAWESVINGQAAFTPNDVKSTGTGPTVVCTAAPTLTGPISAGTVTIGGTWTQSDAAHSLATATITLYRTRAGVTTSVGTATNIGTSWSVPSVNSVAGDVFYAKAQSTGESACLQSASVTVSSCTSPPTTPVLSCSSTKGITGTVSAGTTLVSIYLVPTTTAAPNSNLVGTVSVTSPATNFFYISNGCSGSPTLATGTYMIVASNGSCNSVPRFECITSGNSSTAGLTTNTLSVTTPLYPFNTSLTVTGTTSGRIVRLYINDIFQSTQTAAGTSTAFSNLTLSAGDVIKIYEQSGSGCMTVSNPFTVSCYNAPPIITTDAQSQLLASATSISGTATANAAITLNRTAPTTASWTTTANSSGAWTVSGLTLAAGQTFTASVTSAGTCGTASQGSATATVTAVTTTCPSITGTYNDASTSVTGGFSSTPFSGTVRVYQDGSLFGSTTVSSATSWTVSPDLNISLYPGGVLTVTTQATSAAEKTDCSVSTTIACSAPAIPTVTPTSVVVNTSNGKATFTVSNSQSGVLYTLEDAASSVVSGNTVYIDRSGSVFGTGGSITLTSYAFLTPGTYNLRVATLKLAGGNCGTTFTAVTLIVGDNDLDGVPDVTDIDDDNDGILDTNETATYDATGDADGDGIQNYKDTTPGTGLPSTDSNGDGIIDAYDTDRDGIINQFDLDADNDGIPDILENGGTDSDNDGKVDGTTDADADGLRDAVDANTSGASSSVGLAVLDFDGDGVANFKDLDSDGDGILDARESGLNLDINNNGTLNDDAGYVGGSDGWSDAADALAGPLALRNTDSKGKADYLDIDSDDDGIVDNIEAQTTTGYLAPLNIDLDGDGIDKQYDNNTSSFGGNASNGLTPVNTDAADLADYLDGDSDNDGYPDFIEGHDTDGDNKPNANTATKNGVGGSTDSDSDGLLDGYDNNTSSVNPTNGTVPANYPNVDGGTSERDWREAANTDADGLSNVTDIDDDNDGITDAAEFGGIDPLGDADNDGISNYLDAVPGGSVPTFTDINGDGISDAFDADLDGIINSLDLDSDNDGIPDIIEAGGIDANGDGKADVATDANANGLADIYDAGSNTSTLTNADKDGDAVANAEDLDSDNDGIPDVIEAGGTDANNDGRLDAITDTNGDGWADAVTGAANALMVAVDSNNDGKADSYTKGDFDNDKILNPYDLDSDGDGILDVREAGFGTFDSNSDGTVKTGDTGFADANKDGWADAIDALASLSLLNTDNTGKADYLDIDADDDGITDNVEGQATASYQAPLGTDADKDGIDDRYDNNTATFGGNATNGITPVNTDGDALPDYRDLDSDNDSDPDKIEGNDLNLDKKANDVPGTISSTDTDGDGLLDFWESSINNGPIVTIAGFGSGTGGKSTAQKTLSSATERDWRNSSFSLTAFTVLPVKFVTVNARLQSNGVQVAWVVSDEENVRYYIVERSVDGGAFAEIARVAYHVPQENSNNYTYFDNGIKAQYIQYRIRQVDIDGHFTLSTIALVRMPATVTMLALYPNPTPGTAWLQLHAEQRQTVMINIMDLHGKLVLKQQVQAGRGWTAINLNGLAKLSAGSYIATAVLDGKRCQIKFEKL